MLNRVVGSVAGLVIVIAGMCLPAHAQYSGPSPYLSFTDSPFSGLAFSYFHLETFEGAATPGYAATTGGGVLAPAPLTDSVDADDGIIDGSGSAGRSWFSNDGSSSTSLFTFTFDAGVLGSLPTHVGVVWTDVGAVPPNLPPGEFPPGIEFGRAYVTFLAYDSNLDLILPGTIAAGPLGDGNVNGGTAEDRFFGVVHPAGIAAIEVYAIVSEDWEVDHLQYGALAPIPEPEQWLLMALGVAAVAFRLKRRQSAV